MNNSEIITDIKRLCKELYYENPTICLKDHIIEVLRKLTIIRNLDKNEWMDYGFTVLDFVLPYHPRAGIYNYKY